MMRAVTKNVCLFALFLFAASCKSKDGGEHPIAALEDASRDLPATLAETSLYANTVTQAPYPGVIPYDVKVPFWSDHTHKERYIFVPPEKFVTFDNKSGRFKFPVGTVFAKHFSTGDRPQQYIETRVMVLRDDNKWAFTTYRWNADQSTSAVKDVIHLNDASTGDKPYRIPANEECQGCHNASRGYVLGFKPEQLNFDTATGQNTLDALAKNIPFEVNLEALKETGSFVDPLDANLNLDTRARHYLDVNCSYCHNPSGPAPFFDARMTLPLEKTNMLAGSIITPGNAETSLLWQSLVTMDEKKRMPFTSVQVDADGAALIKTWIEQMKTTSP